MNFFMRQFERDNGIRPVLSPGPVQVLESGLPVALVSFQEAELGIRFAIGTDGTRSDAFRMIDAAETLQRIGFGLGVGDSSSGSGPLPSTAS